MLLGGIDLWLIDYFRRRAEERKKKAEEKRQELKDEILAELEPKLRPLLEEQVKSVKKDGRAALDGFLKEIKNERKGIEAQVTELRGKVTDIEAEWTDVKVRFSAVEEGARSAAAGVTDMTATVKNAQELHNSLDAKLQEYSDSAVGKCTAIVKSEMDAAVQAARAEYKMNIEDHQSLLEQNNMKRMAALSAELKADAKAGIEAFQKECRAAIDAFKKEYAAVQADYKEITPRLDAAAQKFKELEARIIALSDFAQKNTYELWFASSLSRMQRQQFRELYSDQYRGDVARYRKYLADRKESQLKGKKDLTPQEAGIGLAIGVFENLNDRLMVYKREDLPKLFEAIDLLDGMKRNYAASSNSRQGSGRQGRRAP